MYPVSDAFLKAINSNSRKSYWTGSITTKKNSTYLFENKDIVKGSGYITRQCCGSSEIELGSVYAAELGITLFSDIDRYSLEEALIKLYFHIVLADGSTESIPMGVFEVSEANRKLKTLELKGYDFMIRFDKELNLTSSSGTAYSFLKMACTECKVELAQTREEITAMSNGKETLGIYANNDMSTYRDLIFYVAQVLGCVCQINREGKLELLQYGITPVAEIPSMLRFESSYSDFETRYTAVTSTNIKTNEAEYYALNPDDGLTLNLGINPLLQFGLKETRERLITNILHNVAAFKYVPFDSKTIGNPALDPMDVLRFSGGHADETKVSCITNITYNINGKHSLKCVGKNPKLAAAKSKTDKNITGLLNQVESGKIIVYNFVNAYSFTIGSSPTEVMTIEFTSKEETTASFMAEMLLDIINDEVVETVNGTLTEDEISDDGMTTQVTKAVSFTHTRTGESELLVIYKMNDEEIKTFYPKQTYIQGKHILTLFLPISHVVQNSKNTLSMSLKMTGGTATIDESKIRATISGQGLVAGMGDWNGRISITESIDEITIPELNFRPFGFTDSPVIFMPTQDEQSIIQPIDFISLTGTFGYGAFNERISAAEVSKTFTVDKTYPPNYDDTRVEINKDGAFCMISDYSFMSESEEINCGKLQHLAVNTEQFERAEKMEVETC